MTPVHPFADASKEKGQGNDLLTDSSHSKILLQKTPITR